MAIFHLSIKMLSRSSGKSAVAAAAYRAGAKLEEKETGYTHDYTRKSGVIYSEIFLPANAPREYQNREILWNEVQKVEKKSDAQLAREIEVALPVELSREEQITLLQKYIAENFTSAGMCADMAIHEKHVDGKTVLHQNPHAHILLTTRGFKEDGSWAPKEKKTYALDENGERIPLMDENTGLQKLGKRNEKLWKRVTVLSNDWNSQSNAEKWRSSWEDMCNQYLAPENQIDHRSFKRQGIERIPTIHEGYAAKQMERRGLVSERMELNREIKRLNQIISKLKDTVLGIGKRLMELKDNLMKVRMHYGERNIAKRTSNTGRDARTYDRAAGTDTGDYGGAAGGESGLGTGRESNQGKGQTDQFVAVIGAAIERRKRTIDEALERRKEIYERFERLQRLRAAGNAGTDGANAGGTDGKDTDHTSIRERTTAASDLKSFRDKVVIPFVNKLKTLIKNLTIQCVRLKEEVLQLRKEKKRLSEDVEFYKGKIKDMSDRTELLQENADDLERVKRYAGAEQIDTIIRKVKEQERTEQQIRRYDRSYGAR